MPDGIDRAIAGGMNLAGRCAAEAIDFRRPGVMFDY
jgi:hypothetical protein